jgi:hypothetical protein
LIPLALPGRFPSSLGLSPGISGGCLCKIEATRLALARLPRRLRRRVLVRTDSGGGTHDFLTWLTAPSRRLRYSVGMTITKAMQAAIAQVPAKSWTPAYDGTGRRGTAPGSPISPASST